MEQKFYDAVRQNPVIAAVKNNEGLEECIKHEEIKVVFILYGDICNIPRIVDKIVSAGKIAMVHVDLIGGLSAKEIAVDYIHRNTKADGIISTRKNLIQRAKELHMYTVFRIFVIDSMALAETRNVSDIRPDFLEILPGVMPDIIRDIRCMTNVPLLTGGLIRKKQDVINALQAGAMAISATNEKVWDM